MGNKIIMNALILNDYDNAMYATWVMQRKKTIETRMNKLFSYRGDLVICCGKTNSIGNNAGKALCIVDLYEGRKMIKEDEAAACIEWHPKRTAHLLRDWRYFSYNFDFSPCRVSGAFQSIFQIEIPSFVKINPPQQ